MTEVGIKGYIQVCCLCNRKGGGVISEKGVAGVGKALGRRSKVQ